MFLLLFFLSFSSDICQSQMMYSRILPYDPRYVLQRTPVRRSAMEALERLRMPATRYFPQVDPQVVSSPYQAPVAALSGYQMPADEAYAVPQDWNDDVIIPIARERAEDDVDYPNCEYESGFAPVYRPGVFADEVYAPQEPLAMPDTSENNLYNDLMFNYFLAGPEPDSQDLIQIRSPMPQPDQFGLQRRSGTQIPSSSKQGVIPLNGVLDSNKNESNTAGATLTPPASVPSQTPPQVQMTAVPSAPEDQDIESLVIPVPVVKMRKERDEAWKAAGQKEEPLFRPLQNSQRTTWDILTRAKNSIQKRPIPLLKKMIQSGQQKTVVDPLTEELKNLKKDGNV